MWLFFWKVSKKFPWTCCLEVFFVIAKWRIRHKKIIVADHSTRLIIYYYWILWGWWTGNRPQEDLAKLGYRSQRKLEIFGYLTIFLQHARPSSLNLAISQFFPSIYGDFGKKIPRKNLCMKNLWRRIGDETGDWGWNRGYKSHGTPFLSVMATVKLGMKQGVQESRYPVSLSHGYTQIGDETVVTRVKVPHFSHSWLHSNWGWNIEYKSRGTQFLSLMPTLKLGMK
jgi:hypothetical protein